MDFNENNPLPISYNSMNDDQLKSFALTPQKFLNNLGDVYVKPSLITPETKLRIEDLLSTEGLTNDQIKDRIDKLALIKITKIVIDI